MIDPKDYGEIYLIISPTKQHYVGQTLLYSSNGKRFGSLKRWVAHQSDARASNGGRCRLLNEKSNK